MQQRKDVQFYDLSLAWKWRMVSLLPNVVQFFARNRDRFWQLATIAVTAFFVAKGVNLIIAYKYLPFELPPITASAVPISSSATTGTNISAIIARNIFNSEVRGPVGKLRVRDDELVPSTLNAEVLGTIVFKNSKFSVGLIRDRSTNKTEYYGVGEPLQSATISKVERFRVIVENSGRLEVMELKAGESKLDTKFFNAPASEPTKGVGGDLEEIGPNRFVIPQGLLDDTLGNFSKVLTQARMVPNLTDDNRTDGFKIFQIKGGSIYEKLGLHDNDVIKRVNGQDLDSFEKATGLFTALRNEKTISIDVVRNGARISYNYEIRP